MANMARTNDTTAFRWALGLSILCHLVVIGLQAMVMKTASHASIRQTMDVVYERASVEATPRQVPLSDLAARAASLPQVTMSTHHIQVGGGSLGGGLDGLPAAAEPAASAVFGIGGPPSLLPTSVVDLSNLAEASQGDPVLLSYFSAIREQIQRTANQRTWTSSDESEGVITVTFVLNSVGHATSPQVVLERSVSSSALQDMAVRIIDASSPFPPLPPSLQDSAKTIVVPLEFLKSSSYN
ncbi:MAG: TonB family protein [Candidatus Omnitrophica bacterium]|nr:TonB family protein [Candidatus Omnitrophota bacterium]